MIVLCRIADCKDYQDFKDVPDLAGRIGKCNRREIIIDEGKRCSMYEKRYLTQQRSKVDKSDANEICPVCKKRWGIFHCCGGYPLN